MPRKKRKAQEPLTYLDHLEIFRRNIIFLIFFLGVSFAVSFYFIEELMVFLQAPIQGLDIQLNYFKPYEKFITYIKAAFFTGLFFTVVCGIFLMGGFVYPALKKEEKKYFFFLMLIVPAVFLAGSFFAYRVITPAGFGFFYGFASGDNVRPIWGIGSYLDFLIMVVFATGILFLLPLVFLVFIRAGLVKVRTLSKARPYVAVILLVIAALFTPPDVVTQVLIAVPLYLLFEITLIIGRMIGDRNSKR